MLLASFASLLFIMVPATFISNGNIQNLFMSILSVVALFILKWWYRPEFKGAFQPVAPKEEIKKLSIYFIIFFILTYITAVMDSGFYFNPTLKFLMMALVAGAYEETVFRGVAIPIGMRYMKNKNKIFIISFLTSIIFGLSHLVNIGGGANPTLTALQVIATASSGLFFAAVYLRTGSIIQPMLMHAIFDYMSFTCDSTLKDGLMVSPKITIGLILAFIINLGLGILGIYLIRPTEHEKIEKVWKEKWSLEE